MKKFEGERKVRRGISLDPKLLTKMEQEAEQRTGGNLSLLLTKICLVFLDGKIKI